MINFIERLNSLDTVKCVYKQPNSINITMCSSKISKIHPESKHDRKYEVESKSSNKHSYCLNLKLYNKNILSSLGFTQKPLHPNIQIVNKNPSGKPEAFYYDIEHEQFLGKVNTRLSWILTPKLPSNVEIVTPDDNSLLFFYKNTETFEILGSVDINCFCC